MIRIDMKVSTSQITGWKTGHTYGWKTGHTNGWKTGHWIENLTTTG